MKDRRLLAQTVALAALAALAVACGSDAQVTARQIREYIRNVSSPDGRVQSALVEGALPAANGGPTPSVAIASATVVMGSEVLATVSADTPFATILLDVSGAEGYYRCDLPEPTGTADILIGLTNDVPESNFTFEYAVITPTGSVSVLVGAPVTVDPLSCGDGTCNGGETTATCEQDCPAAPECGDGTCSGGETTATCATDCPAAPVCGDGTCNGDETTATCAQDCRECSGDGDCDGTERCVSQVCRARVEGDPCGPGAICPSALYCGPDTVCYNGSEGDPCDTGSGCALTGRYCGPDGACHDGSTGDPCNGNDDCADAADICDGEPAVCTLGPAFCGNERCDDGEDWNVCPDDCEGACGDGVCDATEQLDAPSAAAFCAEDCQVTVIIELDATGNPPGTGEGAYIAGNQTAFGDWTPNTVALSDDGTGSDATAGDHVFTRAFVFDPGTSLEYKYTIGASGAGWAGTEEYGAGNNRGYVVPSDGLTEVRIHDVWAEEPATAGGQGSSTTVTVQAAACVFDNTCDLSRESAESCPTECGPCDPNPCYEGVACTVGTGGDAECGDCPEGLQGDGFTCTPICVDAECPGGGTQECNEAGECVPKDCNHFAGPPPEGYCGTGQCFDGACAEGLCVDHCDEVYGPYEGPIGGWFCNPVGECSLRMCTKSSDCGSVSECDEFEASDGRFLNDLICISHDASRCHGNCGDNQICYLDGLCR